MQAVYIFPHINPPKSDRLLLDELVSGMSVAPGREDAVIEVVIIGFDTLTLVKPLPQIDQSAAFTTQWPKATGVAPWHHGAAGGAGDKSWFMICVQLHSPDQ